jgi:HAD superfamily phosphatase
MVRTETLERLAARGPLALVTGRQEAEARFTLRRFGWEGLFPVVVAMEQQAGREKPDPYPLALALAALAEGDGASLDPAATVYAGDTVDDVRAARAAGVVPIGIVPPYLDAERHRRTLLDAGASPHRSRGRAATIRAGSAWPRRRAAPSMRSPAGG